MRKFHPRRPRHRTRPQCMHPVRIIVVAADVAFDLFSSLYPYCLWSFPRHRHARSCPRSPPRRLVLLVARPRHRQPAVISDKQKI